MKRFFIGVLGAAFLAACNTITTPSSKNLGVLEVSINSNGLSTARLETGLSTQAVNYRESDVIFGVGTTQVVSATNSAFDYLVATFPVSHSGSSTTAFQNLTLYALAKEGNIGDTAIKSISNFGGITDTSEQTRLAKLLIPVHAVTDSAGDIVIDNSKADFQAFTSAEVTAATTAAGNAINANDTILNYGFSARCVTTCTANSRRIPTNGTGSISIAIRVPKAAAATTYGFRMNFVVLDESVSRVTRGVFPPETISLAESRGTTVGASRLMQFGLNRASTSLANDTVDDVYTSKLNASIQALEISRISAGRLHSCGLNSVGAAYCWGNNNNGELGLGTGLGTPLPNGLTYSYVPLAVSGGLTFSSISASSGNSHTCGLTTTGAAYCWGAGTFGQLGRGLVSNSDVPVAVSGGLTFSSISAGGTHTCAVTTNAIAYCWGNISLGRLGVSGMNNILTPISVSGGLTFSSISAGNQHTCGITTAAKVYCWGNGGSGRLGNNDTANSSSPVAVTVPVPPSGALVFSSVSAGDQHSCAVTATGAGFCWGNGGNGRLGNGDTANSNFAAPLFGYSFSSIMAGGAHTCGITLSGATYCWGNNGFGRLGNGGTANSSVPILVSGAYTFSSISIGDTHTCGLTSSGTAYCWGNNGFGQIGSFSSTQSVSLPLSVVSTNYSL
jgi:alpha-tubulin suppressor-like RCC1 family protein